MRQQELQRRSSRLAIIQNHAELAKDMTEEEKKAVTTMVQAVDTRSYWTKLWLAIRGKL